MIIFSGHCSATRLMRETPNSGHEMALHSACGTHLNPKKAVVLRQMAYSSKPLFSTDRNAFCGISTCPNCFIRFFPSRCLAHSLRFRVMSPP